MVLVIYQPNLLWNILKYITESWYDWNLMSRSDTWLCLSGIDSNGCYLKANQQYLLWNIFEIHYRKLKPDMTGIWCLDRTWLCTGIDSNGCYLKASKNLQIIVVVDITAGSMLTPSEGTVSGRVRFDYKLAILYVLNAFNVWHQRLANHWYVTPLVSGPH